MLGWWLFPAGKERVIWFPVGFVHRNTTPPPLWPWNWQGNVGAVSFCTSVPWIRASLPTPCPSPCTSHLGTSLGCAAGWDEGETISFLRNQESLPPWSCRPQTPEHICGAADREAVPPEGKAFVGTKRWEPPTQLKPNSFFQFSRSLGRFNDPGLCRIAGKSAEAGQRCLLGDWRCIPSSWESSQAPGGSVEMLQLCLALWEGTKPDAISIGSS